MQVTAPVPTYPMVPPHTYDLSSDGAIKALTVHAARALLRACELDTSSLKAVVTQRIIDAAQCPTITLANVNSLSILQSIRHLQASGRSVPTTQEDRIEAIMLYMTRDTSSDGELRKERAGPLGGNENAQLSVYEELEHPDAGSAINGVPVHANGMPDSEYVKHAQHHDKGKQPLTVTLLPEELLLLHAIRAGPWLTNHLRRTPLSQLFAGRAAGAYHRLRSQPNT
eukprot:3640283-Rhodomonas_salina.2